MVGLPWTPIAGQVQRRLRRTPSAPAACSRQPATSFCLLAASLLIALSACGSGERPLRFATATELPDEPRHPPGVAVDPAPRLPQPASQADSDQGLVVLSTPADVGQAHEVIERFFGAALQEAPDELQALLSQDAMISSAAAGSRQHARPFWRNRLARLDYGALSGQVVYRRGEVETYRAQDVSQLRATRRPAISVSGSDVLVRVPITLPRLGQLRLFGNEIWFLLRPERDGYKIVEMIEDFRMP